MKIKNNVRLVAVILVSILFALGFTGCKKQTDATNHPTVRAPTVGMQIDDTIVTSKVKSALLADSVIKSSDIKVKTNKGEVMLSGFVDNQDQINRTVAATRSVAGVNGIDNRMALKSGPSTVGNTIDDGVITAKVKSALLSADDLKSMGISVATNIGNVQLSGLVDSNEQISRAAEIAKKTEGVTSVDNELSVRK
jgi:hyperosmotically inducible protein